MPATKDCPLCSGLMRLKQHEIVARTPGNPTATPRTVREWICPDCDYFEEAEDEGGT